MTTLPEQTLPEALEILLVEHDVHAIDFSAFKESLLYILNHSLSEERTRIREKVGGMKKDVSPVTPTGFINLPEKVAYNLALINVLEALEDLRKEEVDH